MLSTPAQSEPPACYIHMRELSKLSNYRILGVAVESGARTIEFYSGDDYLATSRGTQIMTNE